MKRTILLLSVILLAGSSAFAQGKKNTKAAPATAQATTQTKAAVTPGVQAEPVKQADDAMKFENAEHNFGTVAEGPSVSYDFVFKNTSSQPIQLESVRASCGCTTPNWSKDPILPGKTSKITATYSTQGRPGNFHKTITVQSTAGQKILTIKGNVEKAPATSVPENNSSMIKH